MDKFKLIFGKFSPKNIFKKVNKNLFLPQKCEKTIDKCRKRQYNTLS